MLKALLYPSFGGKCVAGQNKTRLLLATFEIFPTDTFHIPHVTQMTPRGDHFYQWE